MKLEILIHSDRVGDSAEQGNIRKFTIFIVFIFFTSFLNGQLKNILLDTVRHDSFIQINKLVAYEDVEFTMKKLYYNNGQIMSEYSEDGTFGITGIKLDYYLNGTIERISNYYKGNFVGYYLEYYENGNIKIKGYYKYNDTDTFYDHLSKKNEIIGVVRRVNATRPPTGIKCFTWNYYNKNGDLIRREDYED